MIGTNKFEVSGVDKLTGGSLHKEIDNTFLRPWFLHENRMELLAQEKHLNIFKRFVKNDPPSDGSIHTYRDGRDSGRPSIKSRSGNL